MISCDLCPFRFLGDVVCMQCPTGYRINFDPDRHSDVGQTLSITMIFAMSSLRIDGRLRCNTSNFEQETDLNITVVPDKREVNGQFFDTLRYQMTDSTCMRCKQEALRFYLEFPDTCPHCHKIGLRKHVCLGPLLTKSKTTPQTSVANKDALS